MRIQILLLCLLFVTCNQIYAVNNDSLAIKLGQVVAAKVKTQQQLNELEKKNGGKANYVITIFNHDIEAAYPEKVLALKQKNTNQQDVDRLWDFNSNQYLKQVAERLQTFSEKEGYDYYIVVCAIYNYYDTEEETDFTKLTWSDISNDRINLNTKNGKDKGTGGYTKLLNGLIDKFSKDNSIAKPVNPHLYHFVITGFEPQVEPAAGEISGRLSHVQGLYWNSPRGDKQYDNVWKSFYESKSAQLAGYDDKNKPASKEAWLLANVEADQEMLSALRSIDEPALLAITDAEKLTEILKKLPEQALVAFNIETRVHLLQLLSANESDKDRLNIIRELLLRTPDGQVTGLIVALNQVNDYDDAKRALSLAILENVYKATDSDGFLEMCNIITGIAYRNKNVSDEQKGISADGYFSNRMILWKNVSPFNNNVPTDEAGYYMYKPAYNTQTGKIRIGSYLVSYQDPSKWKGQTSVTGSDCVGNLSVLPFTTISDIGCMSDLRCMDYVYVISDVPVLNPSITDAEIASLPVTPVPAVVFAELWIKGQQNQLNNIYIKALMYDVSAMTVIPLAIDAPFAALLQNEAKWFTQARTVVYFSNYFAANVYNIGTIANELDENTRKAFEAFIAITSLYQLTTDIVYPVGKFTMNAALPLVKAKSITLGKTVAAAFINAYEAASVRIEQLLVSGSAFAKQLAGDLKAMYNYLKGYGEKMFGVAFWKGAAKGGESLIALARKEFDAYGSEWIKKNPFTGKEMFNTESGGYVITHTQHNNLYPHEFSMAEAFAKAGHKVKLLNEKAATGIATPDAEIIGIGSFDFKNVNSTIPGNIVSNTEEYILGAKKQAENIAFNIADNSIAIPEMINEAVSNAIKTAQKGELKNIANKVGVVYKDGSTKIIEIDKFSIENGVKF